MSQREFSPRYAWTMVVLLTVAYVFSFVDRYILGLLVEPIKADLELSDFQIGLLLGPAFAVFYVTMGLPLGWLADRGRRPWIVSAGILVWSVATAASGLARNFWHLLVARMAVGVGEATLSPCALSMISDAFPPEKRGRPIAFYSAALSLGAAIASLIGATVLSWAKTVEGIDVPLLGPMQPWQLAFVVVGLPGVLLALLIAPFRDPRPPRTAQQAARGRNLWRVLRYVLARWRVFGGFVAMVCVMTIVAYSQGWYAAMFTRTWGWPAQQYALVNGVLLLALGPLTVNLTGWLSDRLYAKGMTDAPMRLVVAGALILVPTGILIPLLPTAWAAMAVAGVNVIGIAMVSAAAPTALLNITPGEMRGQVIALYYVVISLAGLFLGPTTVGILSDSLFGEENLRFAVACVPLVFGLPVLLLIRGAMRAYRAEFAHYHG